MHQEQALKETETPRNVASVLVYEPLVDGIESIDDAAYIFVFPHGKVPNRATIRTLSVTWLMLPILIQVMDRTKT